MQSTCVVKNSRIWIIAITLVVMWVALTGCTPLTKGGSNILTQNLSVALGEATAASYDFDAATGNITIDTLPSSGQLLVGGTLEYNEGREPIQTVGMNNDLYTVAVSSDSVRIAGFGFAWQDCIVETNWQIQLNPEPASDITAYSGAGNINLNLAGMVLMHLAAETGGGNMDVVLPDNAFNLSAAVKSGAGNVTVALGSGMTGSDSLLATSGAGNVEIRLPVGVAALIHASTGSGKLMIDPQFVQIDDQTYQSAGYANAADKIELTLETGAGNVSVITMDN